MTDPRTPLDALLARAGGISGLIYTALPVSTFAAANSALGLGPALSTSLVAAAVILGWQLVRREPIRPALLGVAGVVVGATFALVTGRAKDFYLPGIWMSLVMAILFTGSLVIRRPLVGVVWAWLTGRGGTWRRIRRVRVAFDVATVVMATASWSRFVVQYYLYETDQATLLAVARIAMGAPLFLVTSTWIYLAIRTAIRALPREHEPEDPSRGRRGAAETALQI